MFENVDSPKIIATASVGLDHIHIPDNKKNLVTIINTPKANVQSVAEYTIGCALACCKRLVEGNELYQKGKNNKSIVYKPEELLGKTIGVIGAGNISERIMEYASLFGMKILCWTRHPETHISLQKLGVQFVNLMDLAKKSDVVSVNIPDKPNTKEIISAEFIDNMKNHAIFISVSRINTINIEALFNKLKNNNSFYVCLDLDVNNQIIEDMPRGQNLIITPHIAGGTVESRKRMFMELAKKIVSI